MTKTTDLDLSNPAHPLHRAPKPAPVAATPDHVTLTPVTESSHSVKVETKPAKAKATPKVKAAAKPAKAKVKAAAKADDAEVKLPRSIVPVRFKERYAAHDGSNGDKIAAAFKAYTTTTNSDGRECMDEDKLAEVAKANGIDLAKYKAMNNGQKRMNVGNRLRGLLKAGNTVSIGSIKFADAKKALVVQEPKAKPAPKAKAKPETHATA